MHAHLHVANRSHSAKLSIRSRLDEITLVQRAILQFSKGTVVTTSCRIPLGSIKKMLEMMQPQ